MPAKTPTNTHPPNVWRNRIVGYRDVPPDQLLANPKNWRIHPKHQQDALAGVIAEVGYVDPVKVQYGTDTVIDGHLRVSLALRDGVATIPVADLDLTDAEADLVLATFDPLSAIAATDTANLKALLEDVSTGEASVMALLSDLAAGEGVMDFGTAALEPGEDRYREQYGVIVMCRDEPHQERVYAELQAAGHECRVVVT